MRVNLLRVRSELDEVRFQDVIEAVVEVVDGREKVEVLSVGGEKGGKSVRGGSEEREEGTHDVSHRSALVGDELEDFHHQLEVVVAESGRRWRKFGECDALECRVNDGGLDLLPLPLDIDAGGCGRRGEARVELLEPVLVVFVHGVRRRSGDAVFDGVRESNVRERVDVSGLVECSELFIGNLGRLTSRDVSLSGLLALTVLVSSSDGSGRSGDDGLKMDFSFLVLVDTSFDALLRSMFPIDAARSVSFVVEVVVERVLLEDDADLDIDASLEPELAVAKPPATFGQGRKRRKRRRRFEFLRLDERTSPSGTEPEWWWTGRGRCLLRRLEGLFVVDERK
jgi:hypothetical protein